MKNFEILILSENSELLKFFQIQMTFYDFWQKTQNFRNTT